MKKLTLITALLLPSFANAYSPGSFSFTASGSIEPLCIIEESSTSSVDLTFGTERPANVASFKVSHTGVTIPTYTIQYVGTNVQKADGNLAEYGAVDGFGFVTNIDPETIIETDTPHPFTTSGTQGQVSITLWGRLLGTQIAYQVEDNAYVDGMITIQCGE